MALATSKKRSAVTDKSGNYTAFWEVQQNGDALASPDSPHDIGLLSGSRVYQEANRAYKRSEDGEIAASEYEISAGFTARLMQRDKETLDIAQEVEGRYYAAYTYRGIRDGHHVEVFFGVGEITPQMSDEAISDNMTLEYTALKNTSAVTISSTIVTALGAYTSGSVVIPAGKKYKVVKTGV